MECDAEEEEDGEGMDTDVLEIELVAVDGRRMDECVVVVVEEIWAF